MAYQVNITPHAQRILKKLPRQVVLRLAAVIEALANDPRPHGVVKLAGEDDLYRVRSGDYRIIYQIGDATLTVLVVHIGHRRDVYR